MKDIKQKAQRVINKKVNEYLFMSRMLRKVLCRVLKKMFVIYYTCRKEREKCIEQIKEQRIPSNLIDLYDN